MYKRQPDASTTASKIVAALFSPIQDTAIHIFPSPNWWQLALKACLGVHTTEQTSTAATTDYITPGPGTSTTSCHTDCALHITIPVTRATHHPGWVQRSSQYCIACPDGGTRVFVNACNPHSAETGLVMHMFLDVKRRVHNDSCSLAEA